MIGYYCLILSIVFILPSVANSERKPSIWVEVRPVHETIHSPEFAGNQCLAGACAFINIKVNDLTEGEYPGETDSLSWPDGLTIRAGNKKSGKWTEYSDITETLSFERYRHIIFESKNETNKPGDTHLFWSLLFVAPPEMSGDTVWFRAEYRTTKNAVLSYDFQQYGNFLFIVNADSYSDSAKVNGSFVKAAYIGGEDLRAVKLADSLILTGWRDFEGLGMAVGAAENLELFGKLLIYYDLTYAAHGMVSYQQLEMSPEEIIEGYLGTREIILKDIRRQQKKLRLAR